jgi:pimeloyl-ACP methyl ester carboxylesterase
VSFAVLYLAPETFTRLAVDNARRWAGVERHEITLPGGLHYVYLEGGRGEPLMLLHGFGANKENFTFAARYLTPHYRVIIPDHIGFGESARPQDADYSPAAQVERLRALAQALGVREMHLGGNSMGGQIAINYAMLHPDEVKSLWLLDPGGVRTGVPDSDLFRIVRDEKRNPLTAKTADEFAGVYAFVMNDPPFIPRPMLDVMAQERTANVALEERIFSQIRSDDLSGRVKGLATPALIVWGAQDRVLHPGAADVLHKAMPNSKVIIMPGVGHMPMLERPRQSTDDYLKFRAGL